MSGPLRNRRPGYQTSNERRRFPRLQALGKAALHPADNLVDPGVAVTLADISHDGVSILAPQEFPVDRQIVLELRASEADPHPLIREATVRWCDPGSNANEFQIGCTWMEPLSLDDLLRFC